MAQEEEAQKGSNGTSGGGGCGFNIGNFGRSSKRQKEKKLPQRGFGVAQLEKMRLEEQRKKDGSVKLVSPPSPLPAKPPSNFSVPIPNYQSFSSSTPNLSDLSFPNSTIRAQSTDAFSSSTATLGNSVIWQPNPAQGHGNLPNMWSSTAFNLDKEHCMVDPGLAFRSSLNFFYESGPNLPLPPLMQRAQQCQQQSSSLCPSKGNVSASVSSSLVNFHLEPPSNQSYNGNYLPFWPEEEKEVHMVGMKRPYPSLDNPSGFSLPNECTPIVPPVGRSDEQASSASVYTFNFNPRNPIFRQGSSSSSNSTLELRPKKSISQDGTSSIDFLTLAPPTTVACPISKFNGHSPCAVFHSYQALNFDSLLPYQAGPVALDQQRPYYSFLPPSMMQINQEKRSISNPSSGGVGDNIDLNLKL